MGSCIPVSVYKMFVIGSVNNLNTAKYNIVNQSEMAMAETTILAVSLFSNTAN